MAPPGRQPAPDPNQPPTRQEVAAALAAADRRLDEFDQALASISAAVQFLSERERGDDEPQVVSKDHQEVKCECCRSRLGFYDKPRDILRVKIKDFHVMVHVGEGGWAEIPCRRCGNVNRLGYVPPTAPAG